MVRNIAKLNERFVPGTVLRTQVGMIHQTLNGTQWLLHPGVVVEGANPEEEIFEGPRIMLAIWAMAGVGQRSTPIWSDSPACPIRLHELQGERIRRMENLIVR